jgi:hypothetical protein
MRKVLFVLMLFAASCIGDHMYDLGDGYEYLIEGSTCRRLIGKYYIPEDVLAVESNSDYLIVAQMPFSDDTASNISLQENYKYDTVYFYIIDKRIDSLYGPMGLQEYLDTRNRMGLPKDFRMEVKL